MIIRDEMISKRYENDGAACIALNQLQRENIRLFLQDKRIRYEELQSCKLCGHQDFIRIAKKDRYGISLDTVVCQKCGFIFTLKQLDQASSEIFYSEYYRKIYAGTDYPGEKQLSAKYETIAQRKIPSFLKKDDTVIEIGTGGGWNLMKFQRNGINCYGFDFDENYLKFGREKYHLKLYKGDVDKAVEMKLKGDYVLVLQVLEHVKDPLSFLKEIKKIMKDDALLNVQSPSANFLILGGGAMGYDLLGTLQNAHNFLFDEFTLSSLARQAGFKIISIMGGHALLKKDNHKRDTNHAMVSHGSDRSQRVISYLKLSENLVNVKAKFVPKKISGQLHYLYYLLKPVDFFRKFLIFR